MEIIATKQSNTIELWLGQLMQSYAQSPSKRLAQLIYYYILRLSAQSLHNNQTASTRNSQNINGYDDSYHYTSMQKYWHWVVTTSK